MFASECLFLLFFNGECEVRVYHQQIRGVEGFFLILGVAWVVRGVCCEFLNSQLPPTLFLFGLTCLTRRILKKFFQIIFSSEASTDGLSSFIVTRIPDVSWGTRLHIQIIQENKWLRLYERKKRHMRGGTAPAPGLSLPVSTQGLIWWNWVKFLVAMKQDPTGSFRNIKT